MQETAHTTKTVDVTVAFPLSTKEAYHHKAERHEVVTKLRAAAMHHFRVQEEPGSEYYLTNDEDNDARVPDDDTVGQVAGEKETLELTLVKDLVQG